MIIQKKEGGGGRKGKEGGLSETLYGKIHEVTMVEITKDLSASVNGKASDIEAGDGVDKGKESNRGNMR